MGGMEQAFGSPGPHIRLANTIGGPAVDLFQAWRRILYWRLWQGKSSTRHLPRLFHQVHSHSETDGVGVPRRRLAGCGDRVHATPEVRAWVAVIWGVGAPKLGGGAQIRGIEKLGSPRV